MLAWVFCFNMENSLVTKHKMVKYYKYMTESVNSGWTCRGYLRPIKFDDSRVSLQCISMQYGVALQWLSQNAPANVHEDWSTINDGMIKNMSMWNFWFLYQGCRKTIHAIKECRCPTGDLFVTVDLITPVLKSVNDLCVCVCVYICMPYFQQNRCGNRGLSLSRWSNRNRLVIFGKHITTHCEQQ